MTTAPWRSHLMSSSQPYVDPGKPEDIIAQGGWVCCLRCRAIHHGNHECPILPPPPPRPARATRPVLTGSFDHADSAARLFHPGYGYRVGLGFAMRFGGTDDREARPPWRQIYGEPVHSSYSKGSETTGEADYWRRWRRRNTFCATVHEIARTAVLAVVVPAGILPYEPGVSHPENYRRYRIMGVASWHYREVEIDLGFWVGPSMGPASRRWYLDDACNAAAQAIIRRWSEDVPHVKAGFAWG